MDYLKALGQLVFIIWVSFMVGGTVMILTHLMWETLRSILKGE